MNINFFKEPNDQQKRLGFYYKLVTQYIQMGKELRDAYDIENETMRELAVDIITKKMEDHAKDLAKVLEASKHIDDNPEDVWEEELFLEDETYEQK